MYLTFFCTLAMNEFDKYFFIIQFSLFTTDYFSTKRRPNYGVSNVNSKFDLFPTFIMKAWNYHVTLENHILRLDCDVDRVICVFFYGRASTGMWRIPRLQYRGAKSLHCFKITVWPRLGRSWPRNTLTTWLAECLVRNHKSVPICLGASIAKGN